MIEDKFKLLGPPTIISEKLDILIEAFVEFYGEEKRSYIENKFKNLLILKFCNMNNYSNIISQIKTEFFREIFSVPEDVYEFFYIDEIYEALENESEFDIKLLSPTVKNICFEGDKEPSVIIKKYNNGEYKNMVEFRKKYVELKKQLLPYETIIENEKNRVEYLEQKYFKQLIREYSYLFSEDEIEAYESYQIPTGKLYTYLGYSLSSTNNTFTNKTEELLSVINCPSWRIESIKEDRIRFFEENGFALSKKEEFQLNKPKYEDYINNPDCKKFLNDTIILFEKIQKRKKELNELLEFTFITELQDYKECKKLIDETNFVNKNNIFDPIDYQYPASFFDTNFIQKNNQLIEYDIILINAGMTNIDHTIIHELNHAYENCILEYNEKGYVSISGWDVEKSIIGDVKEYITEEEFDDVREYELMSEYINDRISDEIKDILDKKEIYIIEKNQNESCSLYRHLDFLLEEFYQEFKPIIIKSRSNGNIKYIYEKLGKENFDELNSIINKYYEIFGLNSSSRDIVLDWKDGIENEETRTIDSLVKQSEAVIEKMNEHLKNIKRGL